MARKDKARHRISYVLPLANSSGGHRLGVNGLAVDKERSILYSGGRDGVICTWDFASSQTEPTPLRPADDSFASVQKRPYTPRARAWHVPVQAHTHWINDIVLAQNNSALISASSDLTVKLWRPHSENRSLPETIGSHSDYVKCLATSISQPNWVASGGLDHKVCLWDLNGAGQTLQIDVGEEEKIAKGSVYALGVGGGILAGGGPECIVRVWDPRSGKRVTKLVGHTDNIRGILVSDHGDVVMTASSDQTIKVWSISAGRCIYTLTMHNDSVWSLYSDHPRLSVFYSGDRSGVVAKTSALGTAHMDQGTCVEVCQEHEGVNKVVGDGSNIWTATSNSSINRWADLNIDMDSKMMGTSQRHDWDVTSRPRQPLSPLSGHSAEDSGKERTRTSISSILPLSNTALFPTHSATPFHNLPQESIEGQNGLIKHILLNDRRRVLTLDTAGEVTMWDLVKCEPVHSFGKRHLEEVALEVNTVESIANWCTVDTRTGRLACVLEENSCFDGEVYADELEISAVVDFKDDQRINLGKWVLRYLFSGLIDEEIKRDEAYRRSLSSTQPIESTSIQRTNQPTSIQLPKSPFTGWSDPASDMSGKTPRPVNGFYLGPMTPALGIGAATPAIQPRQADNSLVPQGGEGSALDRPMTQNSQSRSLSDKNNDYFSMNPALPPQVPPNDNTTNNTTVPSESQDDRPLQSPAEPDKDATSKDSGTRFGKKFRIPFGGGKKLGRVPSASTSKATVIDEKAEESDGSRSSSSREYAPLNNFFYVIQKIQQGYHAQINDNPDQIPLSGITPSLPLETPVLKPPPLTTVIIQEDRPDSGGVSDVYRGTVSSVGEDADVIEQVAPLWLGDLLLRNQIPHKETVKVSFVLQPYDDLLPSLPSVDGNVRLNANRMLRVKKILAYVAERIDPQFEEGEMQPEEYLELYCQNQLLSPMITLAALRAHIWKGGGDVMLYYKSNGKKKIANEVGQEGHIPFSDANAENYTPM